jgi:hypothetical protein
VPLIRAMRTIIRNLRPAARIVNPEPQASTTGTALVEAANFDGPPGRSLLSAVHEDPLRIAHAAGRIVVDNTN